MRVVFFGYQSWGVVALDALLKAGHDVPLVVTHTPSNQLYERIWEEMSVESIATAHGIPVLARRYANDDEAVATIAAAEPDVIISSNWRTWLAPRVCAIAKYAALNIHDALLPRYGGFAPINWAIANGETETGVTVHLMTEQFDLGPILLQRRTPIGPSDDAKDLYDRTLPMFGELSVTALDLIAAGKADYREQDPSQATFFHARTERDNRIDWDRPKAAVHNLVRAQCDPYPNAYSTLEGRRLWVSSASLGPGCYRGTPGRVAARTDEGLVVLCGPDGTTNQGLLVRHVRLEGSDVLPAADVLRVGQYLGE